MSQTNKRPAMESAPDAEEARTVREALGRYDFMKPNGSVLARRTPEKTFTRISCLAASQQTV